MIDLLLLNNQNRGLEATGIALQQANGTINIFKDNVVALEFITSPEYGQFMHEYLKADTLTALGHTRKATKGSPRVMNNNHPMFAGQTAVVHNGQIHNDDWAFKDWKLERKAETDSDVLRAVLDKEGFTRKAIDKLGHLTGNAAFAAVSPKYPGKLLLGRSGNPLHTAATADFFAFSSETGPLYKALRPFKRVYGLMMREMTPIDYYMIGMEDDSAWLFSDKPIAGERNWSADWLEWHHPMRIATNYTAPPYHCHEQYHGSRVKFYDDRPVDVVACPGCKRYVSVSPAMLKDLPRYSCAICKTKLG